MLDTQRWQTEVEPLFGPTPIYVYPFGSAVSPGDSHFQALLDAGFYIFCGVGPAPETRVTASYLAMDRLHIDGLALRTQRRLLLDMLDADEVSDPVRKRGD